MFKGAWTSSAHRFIKAGDLLIPRESIMRVDISAVERGVVTHLAIDGSQHQLAGADALEAVMIFKPSALEGRRLRWPKNAWVVHNLIGHPLMQIFSWLGFKELAIYVHDATVPTPAHASRSLK